jgi:hypothetical protein
MTKPVIKYQKDKKSGNSVQANSPTNTRVIIIKNHRNEEKHSTFDE